MNIPATHVVSSVLKTGHPRRAWCLHLAQTTWAAKLKYQPQRFLFLIILGCLFCLQCNRSGSPAPIFQILRKDATGLDFENILRQSSEFNVFNYMYFFN